MVRSAKPAGGHDPGPTDADEGIWRGRKVARRLVSPDGMVVLVGRNAEDNDILTVHVASGPGSHVVVRNPGGLRRLPRETQRFAAGLAAGYSSAKDGGRTAVHLALAGDVGKPRGFAPGKVQLARFETVMATPQRAPEAGS